MKAKVLKNFRDLSDKKKLYKKDDVYDSNKNRVHELQKLGYVGEVIEDDEPSVLDGNVEEVKQATDGLSSEEFKELLEAEKQGKNRKSIIEHFQSMIKVVDGEGE